MQEFVKKLIERLEEWSFEAEIVIPGSDGYDDTANREIICTKNAIEIVDQLAEEYNNDGWIPCSKQLPPHSDDLLLIQCSGKPKNNIVFDNAFCLASYTKEVWLLELYPEWKGAEVIAWMPLPEPFKPIAE